MKFSHSDFPRCRSARGFTLVELLVVITIIVVLAGITFSVTTRVRDQAVAATDTGKFRQVGIALASIAQENNGIIPHGNLAKNARISSFLYPGATIPGTDAGQGDRFNFHELVDRNFPPAPKFNSSSIYNYQLREGAESIFSSKAAKPWPGYSPGATYKLPGPLWFSFNRNLPNPKWVGNPAKVPDQSKIVICGETNHLGGDMQPNNKAVFTNNVQTRYRVSRAGNTALYLFLDGHVERLAGERGESYYSAHPEETNIWKWWN